MQVSTKGRYALRLVIDVALHNDEAPVSLREISKRTAISVKYLEQLAGSLVRGGILASTRGSHGGYRLADVPENITAGDVLRASEGSTTLVNCLDPVGAGCPRKEGCPTYDFWHGLTEVIDTYIDGTTLADFVARSA